MKKYCLFILVSLLLFGCAKKTIYGDKEKEEKVISEKPYTTITDFPYKRGIYSTRIVSYEECEYIIINNYKRLAITHKGNCSNPAHNISR